MNIQLNQVSRPDVVEQLSYEQVLAELKADLQQRDPELTATLLESDPLTMLLEVFAWRELILRQRVNNAAHAVMLAYASGSDLENLAALFGLQRRQLSPGNPDAVPPEPPIYESDEALRALVQQALEGFSTAGPEGAYQFHALAASAHVKAVSVSTPRFALATLDSALADQLPADAIVLQVVDDAGLADPMPGDVAVTVLSTEGDGTADNDTLSAVAARLTDDDVRPLTDRPRIRSAEVTPYQISAELFIASGPDAAVVRDQSEQAVRAYADAQHRLGLRVTLSGLYAALHQPGVQRVNLISPGTDIVPEPDQAAWCDSFTVTLGVGV